MAQTNFLIGRGELLTFDIEALHRGGGKKDVYTLAEAKKRLTPQAMATASALDKLPKEACPGDFGVARMALNPAYIAKSYFPKNVLRSVGLESIGSRNTTLVPEKWSKKGTPAECSTMELFVAGKREAFRHVSEWIGSIEETTTEAKELTRIESISAFNSADRIKSYGAKKERFFEVGLHLLSNQERSFIQLSFERFAEQLNITIHDDLGFEAGNLWFVPVEASHGSLEKLAQFVFVRVIRPVPKLRGFRPVKRASGATVGCDLPAEQPLSSVPRVAILDAGLPQVHALAPWLRSYVLLDDTAADDPSGLEHGLAVTSAFLFGPIQPGATAMRPYAHVDHLRVLDKISNSEDPLELYRTLGFVEQVLLSRQYEFINLSLGPDLPIEDGEVHAWTSVIDDILSDGDTFMTIAAGNNGELDRPSGNARVQVPSDCVNAIAVGAANNTSSSWARATYSAFGPGRSPGIVKPDLLAFGGDAGSYFHVLAPAKRPTLTPQLGTSFAAPYLLRSAVGVRAILGEELSPLAIKALLIHSADDAKHDRLEVGWGKVPEDILRIITCPAGVARIVYQGELKPGKYLRAPVPIPKSGLNGLIRMKATFCYASPTDPQHASSYTRAGLDITFRPHAKRTKKTKQGKTYPVAKGFFELKKYATEEERRADMGKWETVLHNAKGMLGTSLDAPAFDIHYNAREGGASTSNAAKIKYALIITVEASQHPDLYNEILRNYPSLLVPLQPQVSLPIRV